MQAGKDKIRVLWDKFVANEATMAEVGELLTFINMHPDEVNLDFIEKGFAAETITQKGFVAMDDEQKASLLRGLMASASVNSESPRYVRFLRHWPWAAAASLLIFCGLYFWNSATTSDQTLANENKQSYQNIAPGGNRAFLTLADGQKISLDTASNGKLVQQGDAQVVKLANGEIVYNVKGKARSIMWNTMSTPSGGQYRVVLPDGTKVWLNAASSITFPTAFINHEREVKITGEVYFEVAPNKSMPFKVEVDGKSFIQVLGTSFNVNAYPNEGSVKTTLIDGSVAINTSAAISGVDHNSRVILKPGQQAVQTHVDPSRLVVNAADISQTIAWKSGLFDFTGADLKTMMRQLERWYDIKVEYRGPISNEKFEGKMHRNTKLPGELKALTAMDIKFKLEGKTLIIN